LFEKTIYRGGYDGKETLPTIFFSSQRLKEKSRLPTSWFW